MLVEGAGVFGSSGFLDNFINFFFFFLSAMPGLMRKIQRWIPQRQREVYIRTIRYDEPFPEEVPVAPERPSRSAILVRLARLIVWELCRAWLHLDWW